MLLEVMHIKKIASKGSFFITGCGLFVTKM